MRWLIKTYMCRHHIESLKELAEMTGFTRRLLNDRINYPQNLKLFELAALDNVLHFSDEDLLELIRGIK